MLHGWIFYGLQYWNPPPWFFDYAEPLAVTGRGSPTGVVVYRHRTYPERYHDGLFLADWSYGRIYFVPLNREGATYRGEPEIFLQATGTRGFAITAMEVSPKGDVFVTIDGRGIRGGIYRIRYTASDDSQALPEDPLRRVLTTNQPLSSWSRAEWVPEAKALDADLFEAAVVDELRSVNERIRALEVLVEVFGGVSTDIVRQVISRSCSEPELVT